MSQRDNFYQLLELPFAPPEEDENKIKLAIKKKRSQWSRLKTHPSKGSQAKLNLEMLPQIEKVMLDSQARKLEAKQAQKISKQAEAEKFKNLDDAIAALAVKGSITNKEFSHLCNKFSEISQEVIRKRIPVEIVEKSQDAPSKSSLEKTIVDRIESALEIVEKKSLYDFLEIAATSSLTTIKNKITEKDIELKKTTARNAVITASSQLIGHCRTSFKNQESREKYDNTVELQQLKNLESFLNNIAIEEVSATIYQQFMEKATSQGVTPTTAETYITQYCQRKRIALTKPVDLEIQNIKQCGTCGILNKKTNVTCRNCGLDLKIKCPKCRSINESTARVCTPCGFSIGDMPNAHEWMRKARLAFIDKNYKPALENLKKSELFWPNNPEASKLHQQIIEEQKKIEDIEAKIQGAMDQNLLYRAKELIAKYKKLDLKQIKLLENKINEKLETIEAKIQQAKNSDSSEDMLAIYVSAWQECKDSEEVIAELVKWPPLPPSNLKHSIHKNAIRLQWDAHQDNICFIVVRKIGSSPQSEQDGEIIAKNIPNATFDDKNADAGELYYYSVFAIRGEHGSSFCVFAEQFITRGPCVVTKDIENVKTTVNANMIRISWDVPHNAKKIEVWRREDRYPQRRYDGTAIKSAHLHEVEDLEVEDNKTYYYLILTIFADNKGEQLCSQGAKIEVTAQTPPLPVEQIYTSSKNNKVCLSWQKVNAKVSIFRSDKKPAWQSFDSIPLTRVKELGEKLDSNSSNELIDEKRSCITYYIPVTIKGKNAVIGKIFHLSNIPDIEDLAVSHKETKLKITWKWPLDVKEAKVVFHNHKYPDHPQQEEAICENYSHHKYHLSGGMLYDSPFSDQVYIKVFAAIPHENSHLYSSGTSRGCIKKINILGQRKIYYKVETTGFLKKKASLSIQSDKPLKLPHLVLIYAKKSFPLSIEEGKQVLEIYKGTSCEMLFEKPIAIIEKGYYRLFAIEEEVYDWLEMVPKKYLIK